MTTINFFLNDVEDYGLSELYESSENESVEDKRIEASSNEQMANTDFSRMPITVSMLLSSQKSDPTLMKCFASAVSKEDSKREDCCYYLEDDLLMKYRPPEVAAIDDEIHAVRQVVIPSCYRTKVISLALDGLGGYLGVRKTTYNIPQYFLLAWDS